MDDVPLNGLTVSSFELDGSIGHLLRRCNQVAIAIYADLVGTELRSRQFSVLLTVHQNPGLFQIEVGDLTGIDRSTISDLLSRMEKRGLVERQRIHGQDGPAQLFITSKGLTAIEHALPSVLDVQAKILERLPNGLHRPFIEALRILATSDNDDSMRPPVQDPPRRRKKLKGNTEK